MKKTIVINGIHIDSAVVMEKEILNKLKLNSTNGSIPFPEVIEEYMIRNKIAELNIKWNFFSISLSKWIANSYGQKKENWILGSESNMHFQATNDILTSIEDTKGTERKECEVRDSILKCVDGIKNFKFIYVM